MKAPHMKDAPDLRGESEIAWVAALAAFASVISFLIYFRNGDILLYGDAVAHINIARRVFDSRTPGLLQLGTVWLPLPHLLMIPFLISKSAWQTGVGGSFPSMVAYVFSIAGIFRLVRGAVAASGRARNARGTIQMPFRASSSRSSLVTVAATTVICALVFNSNRTFCVACSPPPTTSTCAPSRSAKRGKYFMRLRLPPG